MVTPAGARRTCGRLRPAHICLTGRGNSPYSAKIPQVAVRPTRLEQPVTVRKINSAACDSEQPTTVTYGQSWSLGGCKHGSAQSESALVRALETSAKRIVGLLRLPGDDPVLDIHLPRARPSAVHPVGGTHLPVMPPPLPVELLGAPPAPPVQLAVIFGRSPGVKNCAFRSSDSTGSPVGSREACRPRAPAPPPLASRPEPRCLMLTPPDARLAE